jgi:tryptophanyl-tRNA synthetase
MTEKRRVMTSEPFTVLTGVQPTGVPHIGNYVGAIRPALRLAAAHERSLLFIADYHALNAVHDPEALRESTYKVAACWLALGLDPDTTILYRQSDIPEIMELVTVLAAVTPKGLMDRSHAYKAAVDRNREEGRDPDADVNMGLYTYPILMAADILAARTDVVPVGKDQVQHMEFTRDIAGYFNNTFGAVFKLPEYRLESGESGGVLPGIDGRKMSKSYGNGIPVFIDDARRRKLVMKIKTDPKPPEAPKEPDENLIYQIFRHFGTSEEVSAMATGFRKGGLGYRDAKQTLYEALEREFEEPTRTYNDYMANRGRLDEILEAGALRARRTARATLSDAREAIGLKRLKPL